MLGVLVEVLPLCLPREGSEGSGEAAGGGAASPGLTIVGMVFEVAEMLICIRDSSISDMLDSILEFRG